MLLARDGSTVKTLNQRLAELFRLHHRDLVGFAGRLVGSRENGEDIAQDVYVRMAGRLASTTAIDYPKTYLFTAARNVAIDFLARQRTEWSHRVDVENVEDIASAEDLETNLYHRQRLACMIVALNELPAACRTVFVMNKVEGCGHQEIAERLGISVSMVEKHMMRALVHCRDIAREHEA